MLRLWQLEISSETLVTANSAQILVLGGEVVSLRLGVYDCFGT